MNGYAITLFFNLVISTESNLLDLVSQIFNLTLCLRKLVSFDTVLCSISKCLCLFVNDKFVDALMFLDLWSKSYSFCFEIIVTEGLEWHVVTSVIIFYLQGYSIIPCNRGTDFVIHLNLKAN